MVQRQSYYCSSCVITFYRAPEKIWWDQCPDGGDALWMAQFWNCVKNSVLLYTKGWNMFRNKFHVKNWFRYSFGEFLWLKIEPVLLGLLGHTHLFMLKAIFFHDMPNILYLGTFEIKFGWSHFLAFIFRYQTNIYHYHKSVPRKPINVAGTEGWRSH